jgi:hypothetical protein
MLVDPGTPDYSAGMFNFAGVPRPSFHAFRLLAKLDGDAVEVKTSLPYVHAISFLERGELQVLLAVMIPTDAMLFRSAFERLIEGDIDAGRMLQKHHLQAIVDHFSQGAPEPAIPQPLRAAYDRGAALFKQARAERDRWTREFDLIIKFDASLSPTSISYYEVVDRDHAIGPNEINQITRMLQQTLIQGIRAAQADLARAGVEKPIVERWTETISNLRDHDLSWAPQSARPLLEEASRTARLGFSRAYQETIKSEIARSLTSPPRLANGRVRISTKPHALHYIVVTRK